jgi:hypothetical protein
MSGPDETAMVELLAKLSAVAVVRPGDRLVFVLGDNPTPEQVNRFHQGVQSAWPDTSVLVVGGSIEMAVVRGDGEVPSA